MSSSGIDSSRNRKSRRTLMYFHWPSDDNVRAPQTRFARSGKNRSTLMPTGLSDASPILLEPATFPPWPRSYFFFSSVGWAAPTSILYMPALAHTFIAFWGIP